MDLIDHDFPNLSAAEERDMQLARGEGADMGPSLTDYPYYDESEPSDLHQDTLHTAVLDARSPPHLGVPSSTLHPDLRVNFHDPMLDLPPIRRRNTLTVPYSPNDPVIGSLGTRDPVIAGHTDQPSPEQSYERPAVGSQVMGPRPEQIHYSDPSVSHQQLLCSNPPVYQPVSYRTTFDYLLMEGFAADERTRRGPAFGNGLSGSAMGAEIRRRLAQSGVPVPKESGDDAFRVQKTIVVPEDDLVGGDGENIGQDTIDGVLVDSPSSLEERFAQKRQRKLSYSNPNPRRQAKLAMFEGGVGLPPAAQSVPSLHFSSSGTGPSVYGVSSARANYFGYPHRSGTADSGQERPYRFSFYSNAMTQTIHARSLSEIPAEGQTFEDLFLGRPPKTATNARHETTSSGASVGAPTPSGMANGGSSPITAQASSTIGRTPRAETPANTTDTGPPKPKEALFSRNAGRIDGNGGPVPGGVVDDDPESATWWLDILSPTDDEMRMLSKVRFDTLIHVPAGVSNVLDAKVFNIHPLTTEDILMEEAREKIELFRNYYFVRTLSTLAWLGCSYASVRQVCFRGFDQDVYSPTHLEPLNMYVIVFREGVLSVGELSGKKE